MSILPNLNFSQNNISETTTLNMDSIYDNLNMSDEADQNLEFTPSSFYNSKPNAYISPLDRKRLKRPLVSPEENGNSAVSTVTKGRKPTKIIKRTDKTKVTKKELKSTIKSRKSSKVNKIPVAVVNSLTINGNSNEETDEKYKSNKFFKSKPSISRKEPISWKSFSLYDTKTFNNTPKRKRQTFSGKSECRKTLESIGNKQYYDKRNLSSHVIESKINYNSVDMSISEGYASLPEESITNTTATSDNSQFSESVYEKDTKEPAKNKTLIEQIDIETENLVQRVEKEQSMNETLQRPSSIQDIFKDLEETFSQIETPSSDYNYEDCTFDEQVLNGHVLPSEIKNNTSGVKHLYPIFYPREKGQNTSKISNEGKQKSRSFCKTSFSAESKQMMIDAGQKEIGAKECSSCGMVYEIGSAVDKSLHDDFHEEFVTCLKFHGWKKEHVIGTYHDGRVIMIQEEDSYFKLRKVEEVLKIVDKDLGFPNTGLPKRPNGTFFLFISNRAVVGFLFAESITNARKVVLDRSTKITSCIPDEKDKEVDCWCSSRKITKALCGINRIWVAREYRRKRIASRLLDCVRCNFIYGYNISTNEIAFSDPSPNGRFFATAYAKTENFLVYK